MIGIFDYPGNGRLLMLLEDHLQTMTYDTRLFLEPFDGLNKFKEGDYGLILVNGVLGTDKREYLPSNVNLKDSTAIACYVIRELRIEDDEVPIVVFHNGHDILPDKSTGCYEKAGATMCVDTAGMNQAEDLADSIDSLID